MDPPVPLINEGDPFDPSKTVIYQLENPVNTQERIEYLEHLLELNAYPQNKRNIRVALHAYRQGELPRTDTTYVFIQFGVIIPHHHLEQVDLTQPFWGEVGLTIIALTLSNFVQGYLRQLTLSSAPPVPQPQGLQT